MAVYCVECPQYSIRLEAVRYLCTSCLLVTCLRLSDVNVMCRATHFKFPI